MQVYHDFSLLPRSRSTFPEGDPDPKHCFEYMYMLPDRDHQWCYEWGGTLPRQSRHHLLSHNSYRAGTPAVNKQSKGEIIVFDFNFF